MPEGCLGRDTANLRRLQGFYVNVLWIYSITNIHDISWGNRPEAKAEDLGGAKKVEKDGKALVEVEVVTSKEDLDALWTQARAELRIPVKEEHQKRTPEVKKQDSNKTWRTNFVRDAPGRCDDSKLTILLSFDRFFSTLAATWPLSFSSPTPTLSLGYRDNSIQLPLQHLTRTL